jgi:hypothetical protein
MPPPGVAVEVELVALELTLVLSPKLVDQLIDFVGYE